MRDKDTPTVLANELDLVAFVALKTSCGPNEVMKTSISEHCLQKSEISVDKNAFGQVHKVI